METMKIPTFMLVALLAYLSIANSSALASESIIPPEENISGEFCSIERNAFN